MSSHGVKTINTDKRSKKRIRFASSRERSKRASADVYRSYKRKIGVTSAATREERIHNPSQNDREKKKQRRHYLPIENESRSAIFSANIQDNDGDDNYVKINPGLVSVATSMFASELEVALDRNASEIFGKFHREVWGLVRSLPETLHHLKKIVDVLMNYLLSPETMPERPSVQTSSTEPFVINHATTDILHLLSVLAKDVREELHPYLHTRVLPRIIQDLLNPPLPPPGSGKQPIPLDVTIVEAAFRTLSYIFRYDANVLKDDLEAMRQFYGMTLANRRELVRRLAAETFAPLIRKLPTQNSRQRHLKRVLKAVARAASVATTNHQKRSQSDVLNGMTQLIFQIVKGVPGRLHSQGLRTFRFVLDFCIGQKAGSDLLENKDQRRLLFTLASMCLEKVVYHLGDDNGSILLVTLTEILEVGVSAVDKSKEETSKDIDEDSHVRQIVSSLRLLSEMAKIRHGSLFGTMKKEGRQNLIDLLERVYCNNGLFLRLNIKNRCEILEYSCSIWGTIQPIHDISNSLTKCLKSLFGLVEKASNDTTDVDCSTTKSLALILSQNLLPLLTNRPSQMIVAEVIILATARFAAQDQESALHLIFSMASVELGEQTNPVDSGTDSTSVDGTHLPLFFPNGSMNIKVGTKDKELIFKRCLTKCPTSDITEEELAMLCIAFRCLPFLSSLSQTNESDAVSQSYYKKSAKWILENTKRLEDAKKKKQQKEQSDKEIQQKLTISIALGLEALSVLTAAFLHNFETSADVAKKTILPAKLTAERMIHSDSASVWTLRGVASMVSVISQIGQSLDNELDQIFDALVPNLRSPSHAVRYYSLQILSSFPSKNFVTDHADLDLTDDLDEDPSFNADQSKNQSALVGKCDILHHMLNLERTQVRLSNERTFSSLIARIEVFGRSGKLPIVYAEAAANHMIGLLHVKFAPLWPLAVRALTSLAKAYENSVWPILESKLVAVIDELPKKRNQVDGDEVPESSTSDSTLIIPAQSKHLQSCEVWESSLGEDITIFGEENVYVEDGEVPRHLMTDGATVMETIWNAAEASHRLLAKNSRVIVPLFLRFLHCQYFHFHNNDPSKRELDLQQEHGIECHDRSLYDKSTLLRRLKCFLKAFAAVDGPQQLVHHELLQQVYRSFLTHGEASVANLALSCLMKYKQKEIMPYSTLIKDILRKGKLRTALLDLGEKLKTDDLNDSQRQVLVPVVIRIVFGRLSAKGKQGGNDTPAARRASILSFVSILCRNENELFDMFYLMTRSFIPDGIKLCELEGFTDEGKKKVLDSLLSVGQDEVASIPVPVIGGFLHLLEAVVAQLGQRISPFIHHYTAVLIEICNFFAASESKGGVSSDNEDKVYPSDEEEESNEKGRQSSNTRALCYRRLAEIFSLFGSTVNFSEYADSLWKALARSIELLPEMVVRSEKAPALLSLLVTMSTESGLSELFNSHDQAVSAVIKCISRTSYSSVMTASLTFVENLIGGTGHDGDDEGRGSNLQLIRKELPLLLGQFSERIQLKKPQNNPRGARQANPEATTTWRRELRILCRVSEEMLVTTNDEQLKGDVTILDNMCSLLLPFLHPDARVADEDRLHVLGIMKGLVRQLKGNSLASVFDGICDALSPFKSSPGIKSLQVRSSIANLVALLSDIDDNYKTTGEVLSNLCATNKMRVDEMDFEKVIGELNKLNGMADSMWLSLCNTSVENSSMLVPVVNSCFHFLYDTDGVISRSSFSAIRGLIEILSKEIAENSASCQDMEKDSSSSGSGSNDWVKFFESSIVPLARAGIQARDGQARRWHILLIRDLSMICSVRGSSPSLCGDMGVLCDEENPDLDFFLSITHVQIHRRARAFQRLRKVLTDKKEGQPACPISLQSLTSVFLPLAMHPAYECKMKSEETFALEAIATVGSISRLLSWSKYNNTLWTVLTQVERHPTQERYLIAMVCAIVDNFDFQVVAPASEADEGVDGTNKTAVWRSLENRIVPKLNGLMTKESTDKSGSRVKRLRPTIVLALLKLYQNFPKSFFELKLPSLLAVICDSLRNKDSNIRDTARTTMAKLVISMDIVYLTDVVRELAVTLTEGYKLHVRAAVVHSILQELSTKYKPPSDDLSAEASFDMCVPALMDVIQQDLFGEANERRESVETNVRFVKEAGGSKSVHSIELISRMIAFRPMDANKKGVHRSSIHCLVSPLLERLRLKDVSSSTIRKIRELLSRVVIGTLHNPSVQMEQILPFIYATIEPFIGAKETSTHDRHHDNDDDDDDSDDENQIKVSGSTASVAAEGGMKKKEGNVVSWRPSTLKMASTSRAAFDAKQQERVETRKVQDGASAPKLTGTSRHRSLHEADTTSLNSPASVVGVVFGLNLLHGYLKGVRSDKVELITSMLDPFLPILTKCMCHARDTEAAALALKCILSSLRFRLPSMETCSKSIGSKVLDFLTTSGSSLDQNQDVAQACFKTLTCLVNMETSQKQISSGGDHDVDTQLTAGESVLKGNAALPLDEAQMRVLISLLKVSVSESDQHNPALGLIKAILSRRYISPEFYDLMESMLKLVVRSQKASLRQQSAGIFIRYLLDYPMGEKRFEQHLHQVVANINYEFEEGRMSAIVMLNSVLEKLPLQLLSKHANFLFLPLVLQIVNDESDKCRKAVGSSLEILFTRCETEVLISFHKYMVRWSQGSGALRVASLQVFGLFVETSTQYLKSSSELNSWKEILLQALYGSDTDWEVKYFSLASIEKLVKNLGDAYRLSSETWTRIIELMIDPHPWIKLISSRILHRWIVSTGMQHLLTEYKVSLFDIINNVMFQLNLAEDQQNEELAESGIKVLVLSLPVLTEQPETFRDEEVEVDDDDKDKDEESFKTRSDPVLWIVKRLSQIAKPKGHLRRKVIFKAFAAFATVHGPIVQDHLELMLEPLYRSTVEANNELENPSVIHRSERGSEAVNTESTVAHETLQILEETSPTPEKFLAAFAAVKSRARDKRDRRKIEAKAEAANDPETSAHRKIKKQQREKRRRKRRVDEQRQGRGREKKWRSSV